MNQVKTVEQLLNEGGRFYEREGEPWCDTPLDSWRLVPGAGYVRAPEPAEPEVNYASTRYPGTKW